MAHKKTATGSRAPVRLAAYSPALLLAASICASANDFSYEVTAGAGQTDNVTRVEEDPQDETIAGAIMKLSYDANTRRVVADVVGDFAYYDYLDDTYDSDLVGNFIGTTTVALVPERFYWNLTDNFGQALTDPFAPSNPDNRENLNYLTTGLSTDFRFGSRTRLMVGVAYAHSTYEISPLDSSALVGDMGLARELSNKGSIELHFRAAQLEYDEAESQAANYDQSEGFVRYDASGARSSITADVGYASIDRDVGGSDSGLLLRLDLARRISSMSTLSLNAGQEFSNSAEAFASSQSSGSIGISTGAGRQTAAPFVRRHFGAGWSMMGRRTGLTLTGAWQNHLYDDQPLLDQRLDSVELTLRRDLSASLSARLRAEREHADFEQAGDYTDSIAGLSFNWQLSRRIALNLEYDHVRRNGDVLSGDYTENRFWLSVGYQRGAPRDMLQGPFSSDEQDAN